MRARTRRRSRPAHKRPHMAAASELVAELPSANVLTSKGRPATQSVDHVHFHVLPRRSGDDLALPWAPPAAVEGPGGK
ncbi:HIT family protein [Streptomyces sp. NBC_00503]|uniref:HIT family protein n=1 Tax=Streptomyces sp. NBC_00503 TaxID=2903659 RepID=UPI002E8006DD|nr:HIT domain-containing protein [Streptomyces sp. NBC_00503]WUD79111.1 HIT domain-containing protein [Streptomyces sp. NBC_00503]